MANIFGTAAMPPSKPDTADGSVESCPRCMSPFDNRVHRLVLCCQCDAECSTACCMPLGEDFWCPECDEREES